MAWWPWRQPLQRRLWVRRMAGSPAAGPNWCLRARRNPCGKAVLTHAGVGQPAGFCRRACTRSRSCVCLLHATATPAACPRLACTEVLVNAAAWRGRAGAAPAGTWECQGTGAHTGSSSQPRAAAGLAPWPAALTVHQRCCAQPHVCGAAQACPQRTMSARDRCSSSSSAACRGWDSLAALSCSLQATSVQRTHARQGPAGESLGLWGLALLGLRRCAFSPGSEHEGRSGRRAPPS